MAVRGKLGKKSIVESDSRPLRIKKYPYLFLIVCEDQKTEPYYFNQFLKLIPAQTVYLQTIGTGRSALGVVQQSVIEKDKLTAKAGKMVDEVWVVFDKDDADINPATRRNFEAAFELAAKQKHKVGFSNEVFELWLLLHLKNVSQKPPLPRTTVYEELNKCIKKHVGYQSFEYEHGKIDIIDVVSKIGDEAKAIERAKALDIAFASSMPIDANPSTKVYQLILQLNDLIAYYSYIP